MTYQFIESYNISDLNEMDKSSLISHCMKLQREYDNLEEEYALNLLQKEY